VTPKPAPGGRTTITFLVAYAATYALAVRCAIAVMAAALRPGWIYIRPHQTRVLAAMGIALIVSGLLGMLMAGIKVRVDSRFGTDAMTPRAFFSAGWVSILFANAPVVIVAFSWALTRAVSHQWVQVIGIPRFNITMFLVVPTLAYGAGVMAVSLLEGIINAQRR
jgi:hypothetical protein